MSAADVCLGADVKMSSDTHTRTEARAQIDKAVGKCYGSSSSVVGGAQDLPYQQVWRRAEDGQGGVRRVRLVWS